MQKQVNMNVEYRTLQVGLYLNIECGWARHFQIYMATRGGCLVHLHFNSVEKSDILPTSCTNNTCYHMDKDKFYIT